MNDVLVYSEWIDEVRDQLIERGVDKAAADVMVSDWRRSPTVSTFYFDNESPCSAASHILLETVYDEPK